MKTFTLLLLCLLSPVAFAADAPTSPRPPAYKNVDVNEFEALTNDPKAVILDVRTPDEYATGHIKNAVNLDFKARDFDEKIKALDPTKTYLVHCAVGGRSLRACDKLAKLNLPALYNLKGGIEAWKHADKPIENKPVENKPVEK